MSGATQFLVTGGTGFIGRYVVRRLLARGERVRVFCRDARKVSRLFGDRVEPTLGELCDRNQVLDAVRGADVILHLGGAFQFGRRARSSVTATNVEGTRHLLDAARRHGVGRFVHVSSSGVLAGRGTMLTENDFPTQVSAREPYRRSKWLGERAALEAARRGLPVIIASPTSPLGAEDETPTPTGRIVQDFMNGRFPFGARVAMNFVHVDELAAGILAVADRGRTGERYLLGHHNVRLSEFLQLLARVAARPGPRLTLPISVITLAGAVGELMGSGRVCWETAAHARRQQWFDFSKAADELGWQPRLALETGAREAVEWFRQPAVAQELAEAHVAAP